MGKTGIEFCDKCKAIMVPEKKGSSVILKCIKCGSRKHGPVKAIKIVEEKKKIRGITILDKDETPLPITDNECPECGHIKAYWWLQQTRSADEPPTQFFRCVKCKYTWREYK